MPVVLGGESGDVTKLVVGNVRAGSNLSRLPELERGGVLLVALPLIIDIAAVKVAKVIVRPWKRGLRPRLKVSLPERSAALLVTLPVIIVVQALDIAKFMIDRVRTRFNLRAPALLQGSLASLVALPVFVDMKPI